jgi:DNA polymerase elongation subunit (family B)
LLEIDYPNYKQLSDEKIIELVLQITGEVEELVNKSYNVYAKRYHNITNHFFNIKQEVVARSSFFVAKKRYAQLVINSEGVPVNKLEIKGLDVVRSDFPTAFRGFMKGLLMDILKKATADECDNKIQLFKKEMRTLPVLDVMIPSGVKNIRKYDQVKSSDIFKLPKGTPVHTKAAMVYNDFLTYIKNNNSERVNNGAKIKYAFLIENPLQLDSCALKGYNDPAEIVEYITQYIDRTAIFESKLKNKINDFYSALGWGQYNDSPVVTNFFSF